MQTNLLLGMLPAQTRASLLSVLEPVSLPIATVLFEPDKAPRHVHFLTSGLASIVTEMEDGDSSEVGSVGREGIPESMHLLGGALVPSRCFMQIAGTALRADFKNMEQIFLHDEDLHRHVLRFVQCQNLILGQLAACNRLHGVEKRLARWLLMAEDRIDGPTLRLTQEFLAEMIGVRRSTVTSAAGALQRKGMIACRRGEIRIVDRKSLEDAACECYSIAQGLLRGFVESC
ncbi:MAG: Crp/Fnr family transcriptional regulator [Acidobacteriaceae bacterium]